MKDGFKEEFDSLSQALEEFYKPILEKADQMLAIAKEMNKDSLILHKKYETKK